MKKTVTAVTAGLLLVAGQAVAQTNGSAPRVGDRLGTRVGASSEFEGAPLVPALAVLAIIVAGVVAASDDDSESD